MNMKKVLPILVIASFMLSMIPSVYFASALAAPTLKDEDGVVVTTGTKGLEVQ